MSLLTHKGPPEIAAEVMMARAADRSRAFLIVEGEHDSRFFRPRIDPTSCELVIGNGKSVVVGGIERLDRQPGFRGAVGVIDDDGDSIRGLPLVSTNLVRISEGADLDAFLVWSPALKVVLEEHASIKKLEEFGGVDQVWHRLGVIGSLWGKLRHLARVEAWEFPVKSVGVRRFVNPKWVVNESGLVRHVRAALTHWGRNRDIDLQAQLHHVMVDPKRLCQGHDLLELISLSLEKRGLLGRQGLSSEEVGRSLRIASADTRWWEHTQLASDLRGWEAITLPFRVLPTSTSLEPQHSVSR